jgi:hypothetical protein
MWPLEQMPFLTTQTVPRLPVDTKSQVLALPAGDHYHACVRSYDPDGVRRIERSKLDHGRAGACSALPRDMEPMNNHES